jgi:hypothetical protein
MTRRRLVASVTWGQCPGVKGRPHLGELTIYEGSESFVNGIMHQSYIGRTSIWKPMDFICPFCRARARLSPMAVMVEGG